MTRERLSSDELEEIRNPAVSCGYCSCYCATKRCGITGALLAHIASIEAQMDTDEVRIRFLVGTIDRLDSVVERAYANVALITRQRNELAKWVASTIAAPAHLVGKSKVYTRRRGVNKNTPEEQ